MADPLEGVKVPADRAKNGAQNYFWEYETALILNYPTSRI